MRLTPADRESVALVAATCHAERANADNPALSLLWGDMARQAKQFEEERDAHAEAAEATPTQYVFSEVVEFTFPEAVAQGLLDTFEIDAMCHFTRSAEDRRPDSFGAWAHRILAEGDYSGAGDWTLAVPCPFLKSLEEHMWESAQGEEDYRAVAAILRAQAQLNEAMADDDDHPDARVTCTTCAGTGGDKRRCAACDGQGIQPAGGCDS